jgi:SEC-C motif-containing protein
MRSRYSAYVRQEASYLVATTHSSEREFHSKEDILAWARSNDWQKLEVLNSIDNTVEFKVYLDSFGKHQIHHELSTLSLKMRAGFMDGTFY